jgi:hypothetical protein
MMSLEVIIAVNSDIARRASRLRLAPFVPSSVEAVEEWPDLPIPNFGPYVPRGWEVDRTWFVDKTGVGLDSEPACSVRQFRNLLSDYVADNPGHGFAITEEGQFQMIVSAFRPI